MKRKTERKTSLKARIVEVSTQAFAERGYQQTSLRYIAAQLKYSPSTIYHHFANKESLFLEAQSYGFRKLRAALARVEADQPFERLQELGEVYFCFATEWSHLYELMFSLTATCQRGQTPHHIGEAVAAFLPLEDVCRQLWPIWVREPFQSAEELALFLWSTLHGIVMLYATQKTHLLGLPSAELQARHMIQQQVALLRRAT